MSSRRSVRQLLVAVLLGVLVGGGLMAVTPAGAEVSQSVATSWKKIWKKNLRPLADKRYYTKAQSDAKYQPKGAYEAAGSGYSKAESDAKYAGAGSSYSKAETDAKYLSKPTVLRGMYSVEFSGTTTSNYGGTTISFPFALTSAPTPHFFPVGGVLPLGCSGTATAPVAAAGHLCVFERYKLNVAAPTFYKSDGFGGTEPTGTELTWYSSAAGNSVDSGTWALGVGAGGIAPSASAATVPSGGQGDQSGQ